MSAPDKKRSGEYDYEEAKKRKELISGSWTVRYAWKLIFKSMILANLIKNGGEKYKFNKFGLREGALIGNPLWVPETPKTLCFTKTSAGLWNCFDFCAKRHLKGEDRPNRFMKNTSLLHFPLDEIIDNPSDIKTPEGLFDASDLGHIILFCTTRIQDILDQGLAEEVTYEQAYFNVGLLDRFADDMHELDITQQKVVQVTPKGNTLIFPSKKSGKKSPPKKSPSGMPEEGWVPAPV